MINKYYNNTLSIIMYNDIQPTYFPLTERIIVIGDIHGDIFRLMESLYILNIISRDMKWIAEPKNTIVIQLGDQIDSLSRGGDPSWEVLPDIEVMLQMDKLDKIAKLGGGRVLSLLGNHEIMNCLGEFSYVSPKSKETYDIEKRKKLFEPGNFLNTILAKRNIVLKIGPYLFCHGGILPHHLDCVNNNLHIINDIIRRVITLNNITEQDKMLFNLFALNQESILWTREYLNMYLSNTDALNIIIDIILQRTECKTIFVGHNTVENITSAANNKLFFVDAALSRAYSSKKFQILEILTNLETENSTFNIFDIKN